MNHELERRLRQALPPGMADAFDTFVLEITGAHPPVGEPGRDDGPGPTLDGSGFDAEEPSSAGVLRGALPNPERQSELEGCKIHGTRRVIR